jgi:hypothetical protein
MFSCCSSIASVGFLVVAEGGGEGVGAAFLVMDAVVIIVAGTELYRTRPTPTPRGYPVEAEKMTTWTKKYEGYTLKGGGQ